MKYKIIIESIETTDYPETDYKYINSKSGEPSEYGNPDSVKDYFKTGKFLTRTDTFTVFEQTIPEGKLNIEAVIKAVNNLP